MLLESPPSGCRELLIARDGLSKQRFLTDPNGNKVRLVLPDILDFGAAGIWMLVRDVASFHDFLGRVLGLPRVAPVGPNARRFGETVLMVEADQNADPRSAKQGKGFRYITMQVRKADLEYGVILSCGGEAGMEPKTLRTKVVIALCVVLTGIGLNFHNGRRSPNHWSRSAPRA